jgi:hypothetical protein
MRRIKMIDCMTCGCGVCLCESDERYPIESFKKAIESANDVLKVQGANGNWDYDPYMHGMYNGMEFILSMFENRSPEFREAPEKWLFQKPTTTEKPITESESTMNTD